MFAPQAPQNVSRKLKGKFCAGLIEINISLGPWSVEAASSKQLFELQLYDTIQTLHRPAPQCETHRYNSLFYTFSSQEKIFKKDQLRSLGEGQLPFDHSCSLRACKMNTLVISFSLWKDVPSFLSASFSYFVSLPTFRPLKAFLGAH